MRKNCITFFTIFSLLFVLGCAAKDPSDVIADHAKTQTNVITETVKKIEKDTPVACKSDVFIASLDQIKQQTIAVSNQIDSITLSCQTEKQVLNEKITVRNVMIGSLIGVLILIGVFTLRRIG